MEIGWTNSYGSDLDRVQSNMPVDRLSGQTVFVVGDAVECKDVTDEHWEAGVVTGMEGDKPRVTKTGYDTAFMWEQVRRTYTLDSPKSAKLGSCSRRNAHCIIGGRAWFRRPRNTAQPPSPATTGPPTDIWAAEY